MVLFGAVRTARSLCRASAGGRTVLFGVDGAARTTPHTVLCGFSQTDGPIWGRWDWNASAPCLVGSGEWTVQFGADGTACTLYRAGSGMTDGSVRGSRECPSSLPCLFGQSDGSVWGGWHSLRTVPCELHGRTVLFGEDSMVGTAHAPCLVGSGGWSGSGRMALLVHRAVRVSS